jgi:hypothetical protein
MKHTDSTIQKNAGKFESFLWMCAGADKDILEHCPDSDRIKYQGIGGIIFATGVLAFISSSYAFWTVFSPKDGMALDTAVQSHDATLAAIGSIIGGLVWGLVIFNIDRFIVSSTGSGDGKSSISMTEFLQATPRMLMAGLIGICLSTPLELRILKPEIDAQLHLEQGKHFQVLNIDTEKKFVEKELRFEEEIITLKSEIQNLKDIQENRRQEIQSQRTKLELEAEGKSGSNKAGRGPAWRDKKENLDALSDEFELFKLSNTQDLEQKLEEVEEKKSELKQTRELEDKEKLLNEQSAHQLDGLLARITIAHDIGGAMKWVLTLLLLSIEMGPIFFKMMISKSTYDYLKEQKMEMALAAKGLFFDIKSITDGEAESGGFITRLLGTDTPLKEKRYIRNIHLERHKIEMDKQLELELALTEKVHAEYQRRMEQNIIDNLDQYIQDDA